MATVITLGREGDQWFKISNSGVGREHARITIPDNPSEQWIIEDLKSKNGTFVRDEESGKMQRVSKMKINEMSYVRLGLPDVTGCSFYACHVLKQNAQNALRYKAEFTYIRQEMEQFLKLEEKLKKRRNIKDKFNRYSWLIFLVLLFVIDEFLEIKETNSMSFVRFVRYTMLGGGMFVFDYILNKRDSYEQAKARINAISLCPNPSCNKKLPQSDIAVGKCSKCGCTI